MLIDKELTLEDIVRVSRGFERVELSQNALTRIENSRKNVERFLKEGKPIYGINTGFGALDRVKISHDEIDELQENLIRSHSTAIGEPFSKDIVRAIMLLRINSISKGFSGVRKEVISLMVDMLNHDITPFVPSQGSVGASGDLAPLAHIALTLIGEGEVYYKGELVPSKTAFEKEGLKPIHLKAKEGLALINGTQVMTGILSLVTYDAKRLLNRAIMVASMSIDALKGSTTPFDPRIHRIRPHKGQAYVAEKLLEYLAKSQIREAHLYCSKVQDAYSLRTIPQVLGAVKDTIDYVENTVLTEVHSVTDNPLIFEDGALSGGNFHGEPIALVADFLGIALSEMANISERRIDRLVNPLVSGLPPFLAKGKVGLNSGFMLWQYTAASLVSENKVLSHPSSVDSIPTSAYQEDHVSMGTYGARKAKTILENTEKVIAIEAMVAAYALHFLEPLKTGEKLRPYVKKFQEILGDIEKDKNLTREYERILSLVRAEVLL